MLLDTVTAKFRLNQKVKDEAFDVDAIPQYSLALQCDTDSFRMAVVNGESNRCLWLEDYSFSSLFFTEQLLDQLNLLYDDHAVLQAGFWKEIKLLVKNRNFTLVPASLYRREHAVSFLQLSNEALADGEEAFDYRHPSGETVNIFSAEKKLVDWFRGVYPSRNVEVLHQTSTFLEGLMQNPALPAGRNVFISVENSHLTIVVTRDRKLEFCNTFFYLSVQDFLYYVMLTMDELQLSPDTTRITLYGELSHDSAIFTSLYKYIRHLSFGTKPAGLKFSYRFDEVLDHRYFDLYNAYLCK